MIGKTINGYKIINYINQGGTAEVWYAENVLGKPAAIKILKKKYSDEHGILKRFENEAKIMQTLEHDNIREVYDYAVFEERPCIIMKYLEGEDLAQKITKNVKFTEKELADWWNSLVLALNHTHGKNIIHRDIKPSNIFITNDGKLKLLDFGIAKDRSLEITATGESIGTKLYMSPEQVRDIKHITHKTDIYSLAVTFFHLITGQRPYSNGEYADDYILVQILNDRLKLKLLPSSWRNILNGYLSKKPEERLELSILHVPGGETIPKTNAKTDALIVLLLAADLESEAGIYYAEFLGGDRREADKYVVNIKLKYSNDIVNIKDSTFLEFFDEALAYLCKANHWRTAIILCKNVEYKINGNFSIKPPRRRFMRMLKVFKIKMPREYLIDKYAFLLNWLINFLKYFINIRNSIGLLYLGFFIFLFWGLLHPLSYNGFLFRNVSAWLLKCTVHTDKFITNISWFWKIMFISYLSRAVSVLMVIITDTKPFRSHYYELELDLFGNYRFLTIIDNVAEFLEQIFGVLIILSFSFVFFIIEVSSYFILIHPKLFPLQDVLLHIETIPIEVVSIPPMILFIINYFYVNIYKKFAAD